VHFIQHCAKLHAISESEFCRRIVDSALQEWVSRNLYEIPQGFYAALEETPIPRPSQHRLAALKNKPHATVRLLKPPQNTPDVA
jgi:hypothetical protein